MITTNKKIAFVVCCMFIAACGQPANHFTPQQHAAMACEAEAKNRIGEKTYLIDSAALAASAKATDDGWALVAPITIEPGLRDEEKQTLECRVRVQNDASVEVIYINFMF
jgi:hypothetical protein